jgi:hypothetical protein
MHTRTPVVYTCTHHAHAYTQRTHTHIIQQRGDGDGFLSRKELVAHFQGSTVEADYYMSQMDGFVDENTDEAPDGRIALAEWCVCWRCCCWCWS